MKSRRAELTRRRRSPLRHLRVYRLARGKSVLQVPPAQWAARSDREDNTTEGYAVAIRANSHFDLQASQERAANILGHDPRTPSSRSTQLTLARSFCLVVRDFGCL